MMCPGRQGPFLTVSAQHVRFLAFMVVFACGVFLVYREDVLVPLLEPLMLLTARVTLLLLRWSGMEAQQLMTVLSHPGGFAYEVAYSCIGLLPVVFYAAAALAYPVAFTSRLVGIAVGIPLLLALNFARLVHLFHLGVSDREAFEWWHGNLWPGIVRLIIIGLWISWACWAERRGPSGSRDHGARHATLRESARRICSMASESRAQ